MNAIKTWIERELISRPWFLLGMALTAVIYGTGKSAIAWFHYLY